ncbi:hypothetical protein GGI12_001166, partial [Dipsacomyces acuminosporus]
SRIPTTVHNYNNDSINNRNTTPTRLEPPSDGQRRATLSASRSSSALGRPGELRSTASASTLSGRYRTALGSGSQLPQPSALSPLGSSSSSASTWSAAKTPTLVARGIRDGSQTLRRRLSDASIGTPTMYRRATASRTASQLTSISQVFANNSSSISSAFTPRDSGDASAAISSPHHGNGSMGNEASVDNGRPESRGSAYSATSASTFAASQQAHFGQSGKAPFLVSSLKLDAKIVPPALDQYKAKRRRLRSGKAKAAVDANRDGQQNMAVLGSPRVRVRMDVAVNVLHPGEQCVDLLSVDDANVSHSLLRRLGDHKHRRPRRPSLLLSELSDPKLDAWPKIEHAEYRVADIGEYAETATASIPTSPIASPRIGLESPPLLSPEDIRLEAGSGAVSWAVAAAAAGEEAETPISAPIPLARTSSHRSDTSARPAPVFHASDVSPYPPPPPPLLLSNSQPNSGDPRSADGASAGSESQMAAHYESHTMATYSRARAKASDRFALYSDLSGSPNRHASPLSRRAQSFNTEESYERAAASTTNKRPTSALDGRPSPPSQSTDAWIDSSADANAAGSSIAASISNMDRPHSSIGFINRRMRANSRTSIDTDKSPAGALPPLISELQHPEPSGNLQSANAGFGSELASQDGLPLCEFETDFVRGVFVARLREARRYRLTIWFSVSATPSAQYKEDEARLYPADDPEAGQKPGNKRPATTIYPWETASISVSGLPRSLNTRVRVRLPHRHALLDEDQNEHVLVGIIDKDQHLHQRPQSDDTSSVDATPRKQMLKVNMDDIPGSLRMTRISRPSLLASDLSPQKEHISFSSYGCFYRVRMLQPSRVEPQSSRAVDARVASMASSSAGKAKAREAGAAFSPSPQPAAKTLSDFALGGGLPSTDYAAGWLNTDDSDAAADNDSQALEATHVGIAGSLRDDAESVLDRKLQRFIDEYGRRDTFNHEQQPDLVGSNGGLNPADHEASAAGSRPTTSSGGQHDSWALFAKDQAQEEGFDYLKTEVTVFKLKSVDTISVAWSPRLVEHCQPVLSPAERAKDLGLLEEAAIQDQSVPTSPLSRQQLIEPPLARFGLETILSAGSTPNSTIRSQSSRFLANPPAEQATAVPEVKEAVPPQKYAKVLISSLDIRLIVQSECLQVVTGVTLKADTQSSSTSTKWPEFVDLEFAPLLLAISGGAGAGKGALSSASFVKNVGFQHQSVKSSIGDLVEPCRWAASALALPKASQPALHSQPPSSVRIWIPSSANGNPCVALEIVSFSDRRIASSGMLLTERLYIAIPQDLVSVIADKQAETLQTPVLRKEATPAKTTVSITNNADLWVKTSLEEPNTSISELLLLLSASTDRHSHYIAFVERQSLASATAQTTQLVAATNELGLTALPYSCPISIDVAVSVRYIGTNAPSALANGHTASGSCGLAISASISCTLASFMPWFMPSNDSASTDTTPCLAVRMPPISGTGGWSVCSLCTGSAGNTLCYPVFSAADLVIMPIRPARAPSTELGEEVAIDVARCEFSAFISADDLLRHQKGPFVLPLPLLLFDPTSQDLSPIANSGQLSRVRFARLSKSLLSNTSSSLSLYAPYIPGNASIPPSLVDSCTVSCPIATKSTAGDNESTALPLTGHRFALGTDYLASGRKLQLRLTAAEPENKPELVSRYIETDKHHTASSMYANSTHDSRPDSAIVSVKSIPSQMSSLRNRSIGSDARSYDVDSVLSATSTSLRSRQVAARRSERHEEVDQQQPLPEPATESDPLLASGHGRHHADETEAAVPATSSGSGFWRFVLAIVRVAICLAVMLLAAFFAIEYLGLPIGHQIKAAIPQGYQLPYMRPVSASSAVHANVQQGFAATATPSVAMLLPKAASAATSTLKPAAAAAATRAADPIHISAVLNKDAMEFKSPASSTATASTRKHRAQPSRKTSARQWYKKQEPVSSNGSNEEARTNHATSASFGWIYRSVFEPLLSLINSFV